MNNLDLTKKMTGRIAEKTGRDFSVAMIQAVKAMSHIIKN